MMPSKKSSRLLKASTRKRKASTIHRSLKGLGKRGVVKDNIICKNLRNSIKKARKEFLKDIPRVMYCTRVVISDILGEAIQKWKDAKDIAARQEAKTKKSGVSAGAAPGNNPFPYFIVELTGLVTKKMGLKNTVNQSLARNLRFQALEEKGAASFGRQELSRMVEHSSNQVDQLGPDGRLLGSTLKLEWIKITKHPNSNSNTVHVADPNFFGLLKAINITHLAKVLITPREFQELDYVLNTIVEKVTNVPMEWHFL